MTVPPEEDSSPDFPDQVDSALEALWRGDGAQLDRLLDSDDATEPRLGDVFEGPIADLSAFALGPSAAPRVDGYTIEGEIGHGGMGVVYKAHQLSTNRTVALKVMRAAASASDSARRRFQREVELTARFQHPGIVRVLEGGQTCTDQPYYTMDYVDGLPLRDWVSGSKPDVPAILRLFRRLSKVVEYAHRHDVVHSDLKPGNILIDDEGNPRVLDFGLAKALDRAHAEEGAFSSHSPAGTLPYFAPEQAAGSPEEVDTRTDVWALGAILFEVLAGQLPFGSGGSLAEIRQRICNDTPKSPSSLSDDVDRELDAITLKALQKDKADRYQSARDLGEDLRRYMSGEPVLAMRPSLAYVLRKKLAKRRLPSSLFAASLVLVLGALFVSIWTQQQERDKARRIILHSQANLEAGGGDASDGARDLCRQHPELPEAWLLLAQAQFRNRGEQDKIGDGGWVDGAIAVLERRVKHDPSSRWAYRWFLAAIRRKMGDDAQAKRLDSLAEDEFPGTPEAWYLRSFTTLDIEEVKRCAKEATDRDPEHALAHERLALACYHNGELGRALGAVRRAKELTRDQAGRREWTRLEGNILMRTGQYQEALVSYTQADAHAPEKRLARERATAHLCLREYDRANDGYTRFVQQAVQRYPRAVEAATRMGPLEWALYYRATPRWIMGQREHAAGNYEAAATRYQGAAEDYEKFCSRHGKVHYDDARLFILSHDRARNLKKQGRDTEADEILAQAKKALQTAYQKVPPEEWLADILECLHGELSPKDLVRIVKGGGIERLCEGYYYAGEVCLLNNQTDKACEWFQKCVGTDLELDPTVPDPVPMNEYHLAVGRLDSLGCDNATAPPAGPE